ncbi:MAG TPA: CDP-alcohol phosphatidyltransferase family protein [Dermatophilaceae bacterium]|nr:CDP-alcohol phosphatidyltransferase family protein [Dermatophilaceae bacterium]
MQATVVWDSAVAVVAAIVLCAAQAYAVGVTPATALGAVAGVGLVVALCAMVMTLGVRSCGPADRVTLARVVLIGGCAGFAGPILSGAVPARPWWLLVLLVPALLLDAVDGQVARRTGTSSPAGAKLDGEVDAAALMVLSVIAISSLGWWVLAIGLMRYAFWAAGLFQPRLRGQLPFSQFRRVAAGLQGASLAVALTSVVPLPDARALVAVALALLLVSFGRDVVWLVGRRPVSTG